MNNPLKKRFVNALNTLIDDYGIPATKIAVRTGVDLSVIRRVRANRSATITIEYIQKLETLIQEISAPTPLESQDDKIKALIKRIDEQETLIRELETQIRAALKLYAPLEPVKENEKIIID